jgi:hypothetical protein
MRRRALRADAPAIGIVLLGALPADGLWLRGTGFSPRPTASHETEAPSICRLRNEECLDYTYTADGSERLANLTFEGPSLRLELNYAGNYNRSTRDSQQSICINGHLAPSFFLLGAQKSATTNFAARFAQAALSVVPRSLAKQILATSGRNSTFSTIRSALNSLA